MLTQQQIGSDDSGLPDNTRTKSRNWGRNSCGLVPIVCLLLTLAGCAHAPEGGEPAGPDYWVNFGDHAPAGGGWMNIKVEGSFEALGEQFYKGTLTDSELETLQQQTTPSLIGVYELDALSDEEEAALSDDDTWQWVQINRQSVPFGAELSGAFDAPATHAETRAFLEHLGELYRRYTSRAALAAPSTSELP